MTRQKQMTPGFSKNTRHFQPVLRETGAGREAQVPPQGEEEHDAQNNSAQHQDGQEHRSDLPQGLQKGDEPYGDKVDHGVEQNILPDPSGAQGDIAQHQADDEGVEQLIQIAVKQAEAQSRGQQGEPVAIGPQPVQQQLAEHHFLRHRCDDAAQQDIEQDRVGANLSTGLVTASPRSRPMRPVRAQGEVVGQIHGAQADHIALKEAGRARGRASGRGGAGTVRITRQKRGKPTP